MKLWPWSKPKQSRAVAPMLIVRGKYDAAQTTPDNRRHWSNADGLSPNAALTPEVRRVLRNRARYEVANNSYAQGIVSTLANDMVGTGPRLQMLTDDPKANDRVERFFEGWALAVDLPEKLRCMRMARAESGEVFGVLTSNPRIDSPVKLDLRLIEADQVTSPPQLRAQRGDSGHPGVPVVDGITIDRFGNPVAYTILRYHPGDGSARGFAQGGRDYQTLPAESVIHYYRATRPGQVRGIPDITPALPLFAQLRRYTLAVIGAAESVANIAVLMKTNTPAGGEAAEVEPMTEMDFAANMAVFTPEGWEPHQIKAEQPATTYGEFKREILNEIARCLNMPFNVAAGNSSGYNYASGRLDHQTYFKSIRVEQSHIQTVVLDRILRAWLDEATLVEGLLPQFMRRIDTNPLELQLSGRGHLWFWDGVEHVDPAKEANAQASRLANHTTTLAYEYARQGRDWEEELKQRAKEMALMNKLGLTLLQAQPNAVEPKDDDDAKDTDTEEAQAIAA